MTRKEPLDLKISEQGKRVTYKLKTKRTSYRGVCDKTTGFISEVSTTISGGVTPVQMYDSYFAPKQVGGLILPRVHVGWSVRNDEVIFFDLHLLDKVEAFESLPAQTFALSLPGTSMPTTVGLQSKACTKCRCGHAALADMNNG